ncbi:MAG: tRNA lysidine(34) synthetase TilS [Candidatus Neomarinimicrobiota bacterium]
MKAPGLMRKFTSFVEDNRLLDDVRTVIAGVSGGVDSMCLLDLLLARRSRWEIEIVVAHFNHQIRGALADRDEELVRRFCAERSLTFLVERADVPKMARKRRISLEMAGRELRYAFFQKIAEGYPGGVVATAHTRDDQAETILLRILKGGGLHGLSGITLKRDNLVRPLLFAGKDELYAYAREKKLAFVEDHTNLIDDCERNFIRNQLLPAVKRELNPNVAETLANLAQILSEARQILMESARPALASLIINANAEQIVLDKSGLKTYFIGIEKEIIWQCLQRLAGAIQPLSFKRMNALTNLVNEGATGRRMTLEQGITVLVDRDRVLFQRAVGADWAQATVSPGEKIENEWFTFTSELLDVNDFKKGERRSGTEFVDFDRIGSRLNLRHWQKGDRMLPLGMRQSRKVSDIFVDLKIPLTHKTRIPLLCSDNDVIWLCGLKLSEKFKITDRTRTVLKLTYEEKHK